MTNSAIHIQSFAPIIDKHCTRLILGSIPGVTSLQKLEYYGHPANAFWRILFALYDSPELLDYTAKQHFLLAHHIAVWDVIGACEREGSLDSRIKQTKVNDFDTLYQNYPNLNAVFFNGAKAYDTYKKEIGFDAKRTYTRLPSTSPAHAVAFTTKLAAWRAVLPSSGAPNEP